jgi:hypothetical protein
MVKLAEFHLQSRPGVRIWISRSYADSGFVAALTDADRLLNDASCLIVKDEKRTKVGRLAIAIAGAARAFYIKRYNRVSLGHAVLSSLGRSGAVRALRGAALLQNAGIATVTPVAAVEKRRCGIVCASFFISEEVIGGKTTDAYWKENLQRVEGRQGFRGRLAFLRQLAGLFQTLHARKIYHADLKDANIMVASRGHDQPAELFLLDLEGVRQELRLSERRRIKNLVQLYRTLGRSVSPQHRWYFLKCYLGSSFTDRQRKREFVRRVLEFAARVEKLKARRRERTSDLHRE